MNPPVAPNSIELIESIKSNKLPVIIFGASTVGEVLSHHLEEQGITVTAFTENQAHKTEQSFCGIEVIHTSKLQERFKDAHFIISAADIEDVIHQLNELGFYHTHAAGILIQNIDLEKRAYSAPVDFVEFAVSACITCHDSFLSPETISLRSVDIMVTEKCSLKCTDCSNLMQYFKEPVHYQLEEMLQSVETLCASVDSIHEFRVIGGEPLMNKNVYGVIEKLSSISKVKRVVIYTNGSIPINMKYIDILQNPKVILMITSYGHLSKNLSKMESVCDEYKITYHTRPAQGWTDSSKIAQHHRDTKTQNKIFQSCCAKSLYTLSEGELHRCPFSANAARLGAIPDYKNDYINLLDPAIVSSGNRNRMQQFTSNMTEALSACDFCNGRPLDDPQITPGIQTKEILDYTRVRT